MNTESEYDDNKDETPSQPVDGSAAGASASVEETTVTTTEETEVTTPDYEGPKEEHRVPDLSDVEVETTTTTTEVTEQVESD